MNCFLELRGVSKSYPSARGRTEVLHNINLSIAQGEFVAIVGCSGAGKTTLINLIAGLTQPDAGTATLNGQTITEPGPDRGVVFQNYSLLPWLSVAENIRLAVDPLFPDWPVAKREQHVDRHIAMVGLTHARDRRPAQLSGGMRQRVSVARALAMDPQILLLDEPLGALDALTRATLQDELGRIWQDNRKTVVLITNDPDEGLYLADRIIPLGSGPRATLGPPIAIDIPRPRDRRTLSHDPRYKAIRRQLVEFLLGSRASAQVTVTRKLVLPAIEPEDLDRPRHRFGFRRRPPVRRTEVKRETVEVA
jgi:nitrate/nitrite transport system ATP-binding protein